MEPLQTDIEIGEVGSKELLDTGVGGVGVQSRFLSIVVPTFNESKNVLRLIELLEAQLSPNEMEIIFVDDSSPDGTADLLRTISKTRRHVRLIERWGRRGLASACAEGVQAASGELVLIMDADLQHDESIIPEMREMILRGEADVVSGSRFLSHEPPKGLSPVRRLLSLGANFLARTISGYQLTDPMSGFVMFHRDDFKDAYPRMANIGYKLYLDFLCSKKRRLEVKEVEFSFRGRESGESKLGILVLWQYILVLLSKLSRGLLRAEFIGFCIVGASGVGVYMGIVTVLYSVLGLDYRSATMIAIVIAIISNYTFNNLLTYWDQRRRKLGTFLRGLLWFGLICSLGAVMNFLAANGLRDRDIHWIIASLAGIGVGTFWNFALSRLGIWHKYADG